MGVKSNQRDSNISARIRLILLNENVFYVNMHQEKKCSVLQSKGECEYSTANLCKGRRSMEVVIEGTGRNCFATISQAANGHLKTDFFTVTLQPASGTLHNACKLKLLLVTGAFGTAHITEFSMFKELRCNSRDAKSMKSQC